MNFVLFFYPQTEIHPKFLKGIILPINTCLTLNLLTNLFSIANTILFTNLVNEKTSPRELIDISPHAKINSHKIWQNLHPRK